MASSRINRKRTSLEIEALKDNTARETSFVDHVILQGKPLLDSSYSLDAWGLFKALDKVGIKSVLDVPHMFYPTAIMEFYSNLVKGSKGNLMSMVQNVRISLNSTLLDAIMGFTHKSELEIFAKHGLVEFKNFSGFEQLQVVMGGFDLNAPTLPYSLSVTPLAKLMFHICKTNLCPRLGGDKEFTSQDLIVVAMILAGKPFDMGELILNFMYDAGSKGKTTLPYGCLLTKVFQFYKVKLDKSEAVYVTEFIAPELLSRLQLKVIEDGALEHVKEEQPTVEDNGDYEATTMDHLYDKIDVLDIKVQEVKDHLLSLSARITRNSGKPESAQINSMGVRSGFTTFAATEHYGFNKVFSNPSAAQNKVQAPVTPAMKSKD